MLGEEEEKKTRGVKKSWHDDLSKWLDLSETSWITTINCSPSLKKFNVFLALEMFFSYTTQVCRLGRVVLWFTLHTRLPQSHRGVISVILGFRDYLCVVLAGLQAVIFKLKSTERKVSLFRKRGPFSNCSGHTLKSLFIGIWMQWNQCNNMVKIVEPGSFLSLQTHVSRALGNFAKFHQNSSILVSHYDMWPSTGTVNE